LLNVVIGVFCNEQNDMKTAEKYVVKLESQHQRVLGYILCGNLKKAYLDSVKADRPDQVELVRAAAKKQKQDHISQLCNKYLRQFQPSAPPGSPGLFE
jgi:zinc finger FYVE domain-containing protein 26